MVEKTQIDLLKEKNSLNQANLTKIEIKELLNVNFSVALYD